MDCSYRQYLSVLYDKNEVIVYNMQKKERIFRAVYKEATGSITNLFYVKDFEDEIEIDEDFDEED